ncbi:MAG: DNA-binding domain-containing protein [Novosphingobium sp.]|uniref:HvfC/BufC family peptide modification chaperone n=1 Tax=Novosphingobium sp. TaxID=1874826 RepID=UPI003C7E2C13
MTHATSQQSFLADVSASDDAPAAQSTGMAIYRNAYRARLTDALAVSFERTRRWTGDEAFAAASAHYIITHPPHSWTLDAYGDRFVAVLADLFAQNAEVAELAWLEWHMQQAFAAADQPELTAAALAAARLRDEEWETLRFGIAAGFAAREVRHDCAALWHALGADPTSEFAITPIEPSALVVWRCALSPHFRLLDCDEFAALGQLAAGKAFGEVAAQAGEQGIARFGQWFAQWLGEGLFSAAQRG